MSHLLIPGDAGSSFANLWVAAVDEDSDAATLEVVAATGERVPVGAWESIVTGGSHEVRIARPRLNRLRPRVRRRVELRRGAAVLATATIGTLPDRLPGLGDRPFTILLGSCFSRAADAAGTVGRAYSLLPTDARPDVKILCGDQVYLDAPSVWTVIPAVTKGELRRRLLEIYLATWMQAPGFHDLLADGPNLFTSDDHDYWNNAPNWSATAPATMVKPLRDDWWAAATDLYRAFQRPMPPGALVIDMAGLSMCVADTRANRTSGTDAFLAAQDLADIRTWAANLRTPGCLVLGQLLFAPPAGWRGRFSDWGLADFDQFPALVDAIAGARHTVIVLTGDVHFGRVAVCEIDPLREVVEVVASPLSLVAPIPKNDWHRAPDLYPSEALSGRVRRQIRTEGGYQLNSNHFATVELSRGAANGWTRMRVRAWPTTIGGRLPVATRDYLHWVR